MKHLTLIFTFLCTASLLRAQDDKAAIDQLITEDSSDVYKLATYHENIRNDIFQVASIAKALGDVQEAEKKSNRQFTALIISRSMDNEKKIWNLVRYKNLVSDLVKAGKKNKKGFEEVLQNYPKEIYNDALRFARHDFKLLENINKVQEDFNTAMDNILKAYPAATQTAFRELLNTPEVISILNNNLTMSTSLGNLYRQNPNLVKTAFDSLNAELAEQKKKDIESWTYQMESDPQAEKELEQAAKDYAQDQGEDSDDYAPADANAVDNYACDPYPYWCGYPYWYDYEYWYPYPAWYDWGFYFGVGGIVWFGLPSWGFMHWYFWHSDRFFLYPHLTNAYIGFYYGEHRAEPYGGVVVRQWVRENQAYLPKDFAENPKGRVDAIKEYGRFSNNYSEAKIAAGGNLAPEKYMSEHGSEYPNLQHPAVEEANPASRTEMPAASKAPHEEWINNRNGTPRQPSYHATPRVNISPRVGGGVRGGSGGGGFHGGGGGHR